MGIRIDTRVMETNDALLLTEVIGPNIMQVGERFTVNRRVIGQSSSQLRSQD